jgi:hypothetical protein
VRIGCHDGRRLVGGNLRRQAAGDCAAGVQLVLADVGRVVGDRRAGKLAPTRLLVVGVESVFIRREVTDTKIALFIAPRVMPGAALFSNRKDVSEWKTGQVRYFAICRAEKCRSGTSFWPVGTAEQFAGMITADLMTWRLVRRTDRRRSVAADAGSRAEGSPAVGCAPTRTFNTETSI